MPVCTTRPTNDNFTEQQAPDIHDVLSLNNSKFVDYVEHIYPIELEIKDTTDTVKSASYLDLHLKIDNEGRLKTKLYDKRDDFSFLTVNFLFLSSKSPAAPAYGVFISHLIRYSRASISYHDYLEKRVAAYKEAIKPRVSNGEVEIIPS